MFFGSYLTKFSHSSTEKPGGKWKYVTHCDTLFRFCQVVYVQLQILGYHHEFKFIIVSKFVLEQVEDNFEDVSGT